jgi:hypothetical protein
MTYADSIKIVDYGAVFSQIVQQQETTLPVSRDHEYFGNSAKEGRFGFREADEQNTVLF